MLTTKLDCNRQFNFLPVKTFKIKKSMAATDVETTSPNKSSNIDNNSHNGLPVKQSIAIALASKLNKKNTTSHSGIDVELPRLIPIASEPTCNPYKEQLLNESLHPASFDGEHFMPINEVLLDATAIVEDVEDSILASAVVSSNLNKLSVLHDKFHSSNYVKVYLIANHIIDTCSEPVTRGTHIKKFGNHN